MYFVFLLTMKIEQLLPVIELIECFIQLSGDIAQVLQLSHIHLFGSCSLLISSGDTRPEDTRQSKDIGVSE